MKRSLLLPIFLAYALPLCAQPVNVQMSQPGSDPEELTIAINPTDIDNIIAGANLRYFFHSKDGGRTWGQGQLPQNTYGDPCVLFGPDGRALGESRLREDDAMTAQECARLVVRAMERRQRMVVMTLKGKLGRWVKLVAPALVDRMSAAAVRKGR